MCGVLAWLYFICNTGSPISVVLLLAADEFVVEAMVDAVLSANPNQLFQYCAGKTKLAGFFTGQVMKESQGRVNPGLMNKVLVAKLKAAAEAAAEKA